MAVAKGLCFSHYMRKRRHGDVDVLQRAPNGSYAIYLEMALKHTGDDCFLWPSGGRGYPKMVIDGKRRSVTRYICEWFNGPPPTAKHEAAHWCGKGKQGCVTPEHLHWATRIENEAEKGPHWRSRSRS